MPFIPTILRHSPNGIIVFGFLPRFPLFHPLQHNFSFLFLCFICFFFENHKMFSQARGSERNFSTPKKKKTLLHDDKISLFSQIHKKFRDGFSCNNIGKYVIKMLHIYFGALEVSFSRWEMSEMLQCERSARCRPSYVRNGREIYEA